jgi:hypothetical protein
MVKKSAPAPRFHMTKRGKSVHVVRTKAWDLKNSECQVVRKGQVADSFKGKGMSPEAALALDACDSCGTHAVAEAAVKASATPEQRRAESEDRRNEVMDRASGKKRKTAKAAKPPAKAAEKSPPPVGKQKPVSKTKAGTRSVASVKEGDAAQAKAQQLIAFGEASGWKCDLKRDDETGHWVVVCVRGDATVRAWYIDGKYDINRHAEIAVGSWTGKLRGAHAARRQMSSELEDADRPHPKPGVGRKVSHFNPKESGDVVPEDESPEDAARRVPFSADDPADEIIAAISGKVIRWRVDLSNTVTQARVPTNSPRTTVSAHPKNGKRILSFLEVVEEAGGREILGPERNIALAKIIRVIG